MDHEVVSRPCKICDEFFNFSQDHFSLHQGKNVKASMKLEVPKRYIIRPSTLSIDMVQNRRFGRKRQGPMVEECCYYEIIMNFILEVKKCEDKRRQKIG
jgi:hypothetical protein